MRTGGKTLLGRQFLVQRQTLGPFGPQDGSHVDDAATARDAGQHLLGQVAHTQVVHAGHQVPVGRAGHAGHIAKGIDALRQLGHGRIDGLNAGQVGLHKAVQGQARVIAVHANDLGTLEAGQPRDFGANAGGRAGDDNCFSLQTHGICLLDRWI